MLGGKILNKKGGGRSEALKGSSCLQNKVREQGTRGRKIKD